MFSDVKTPQNIFQNDFRTRRVKNNIQVRKNRRAEKLSKRRNESSSKQSSASTPSVSSTLSYSNINGCFNGLKSDNPEDIYNSLKFIKKWSRDDPNVCCDALTSPDILPHIMKIIKGDYNYQFQHLALWILIDISNTHYDWILAEKEQLYDIVDMIKSSDPQIRDDVLWILANLAAGGYLGDKLLKLELTYPVSNHVMDLLRASKRNHTMLKNAVWFIHNLLKRSSLNHHGVVQYLDIICKILDQCGDISPDIWFTFRYFWKYSKHQHHRHYILKATTFLKHVKQFMASNKDGIEVFVQMIGNIATQTDDETQYLIDLDIVPWLMELESTTTSSVIRSDVFWICSNIAAGPKYQRKVLYDNKVHTKAIDYTTNTVVSAQVRRECMWTIVHLFYEDRGKFEDKEIAQCLLGFLETTSSPELQVKILRCIQLIAYDNPDDIEELGGIDILEKYAMGLRDDISILASNILDVFN